MYRLVADLLQPYPLVLLTLFTATIAVWRRCGPGSWLLKVPVALTGLLAVLSTPLAGYLALGSLEWSYPPLDIVPAPPDTIVVLSGTMMVNDKNDSEILVGPSTFYRCSRALALYKHAGHCRIVVTGGKIDRSEPGPALAEVMRDFLVQLGVSRDDIALETEATTTYENALFTKPILENTTNNRVFLITDAFHMRRAERSFRRLGVAVVPVPCSPRASKLDMELTALLPSTHGMQGVEIAFHEWLGLAWYWLRGR